MSCSPRNASDVGDRHGRTAAGCSPRTDPRGRRRGTPRSPDGRPRPSGRSRSARPGLGARLSDEPIQDRVVHQSSRPRPSPRPAAHCPPIAPGAVAPYSGDASVRVVSAPASAGRRVACARPGGRRRACAARGAVDAARAGAHAGRSSGRGRRGRGRDPRLSRAARRGACRREHARRRRSARGARDRALLAPHAGDRAVGVRGPHHGAGDAPRRRGRLPREGRRGEEIVESIHRVASGRAAMSADVVDGIVLELSSQLRREEIERERFLERAAEIQRFVAGDGICDPRPADRRPQHTRARRVRGARSVPLAPARARRTSGSPRPPRSSSAPSSSWRRSIAPSRSCPRCPRPPTSR